MLIVKHYSDKLPLIEIQSSRMENVMAGWYELNTVNLRVCVCVFFNKCENLSKSLP